MKIRMITQTLVIMVLCSGCLADERPPTEDYIPFVKAIHPYETFSAVRFEDPEGVFTRKNYDLYLTAHARHYREAFTLDEIKEIAEFYSSDIGKRFMEFHRKEDPFSEFLDQMRKAGEEKGSEESPNDEWTCPLHPDIRSPDERTCPICGMELTVSENVEK